MKNELLDDFQASSTTKKMVHASGGKRLLATGVDIFIIMGIFMIFSDLAIGITSVFFVYSSYFSLLSFMIMIFYIAFAESSAKQGTLGKQFLKIKVVNKQGKRITFRHALGRISVKIALSPMLLVAIVLSSKNMRNGDILGTYVIENKLGLDE